MKESPLDAQDGLISAHVASKITGRSPKTLARWAKAGKITRSLSKYYKGNFYNRAEIMKIRPKPETME